MSKLEEGRVVRMDAKVCHVSLSGVVVHAAPRGSLFENLGDVKNPIAVGDRVLIDRSSDPASLEQVLKRANCLSRTASSHDPRQQILAANVDHLFVIASVRKPKFSSNRTDRILAACEWQGIEASLVLNKTDLAKAGEREAIEETYRGIPVEVLSVCAKTGEGLDELAAGLIGKTSIFYGASGAGKSTILNYLQPGLDLKVGKISSYWEQGRHTTTYSRLHVLDLGGQVIDTPGIRVFRLHRVHVSELKGLFPEFARYEDDCHFPNCTHDHEPECAVLDALEAGKLPQSRYMSYLELLMEASPDPTGDEDFVTGEAEET